MNILIKEISSIVSQYGVDIVAEAQHIEVSSKSSIERTA